MVGVSRYTESSWLNLRLALLHSAHGQTATGDMIAHGDLFSKVPEVKVVLFGMDKDANVSEVGILRRKRILAEGRLGFRDHPAVRAGPGQTASLHNCPWVGTSSVPNIAETGWEQRRKHKYCLTARQLELMRLVKICSRDCSEQMPVTVKNPSDALWEV
jgi:hypothetical protein